MTKLIAVLVALFLSSSFSGLSIAADAPVVTPTVNVVTPIADQTKDALIDKKDRKVKRETNRKKY